MQYFTISLTKNGGRSSALLSVQVTRLNELKTLQFKSDWRPRVPERTKMKWNWPKGLPLRKISMKKIDFSRGAHSRHFSIAFTKNLEICFLALVTQYFMLITNMTLVLGFGHPGRCRKQLLIEKLHFCKGGQRRPFFDCQKMGIWADGASKLSGKPTGIPEFLNFFPGDPSGLA